ncbi:hypothetical protein BX616_005880, partial [Lobosporangium transversale]
MSLRLPETARTPKGHQLFIDPATPNPTSREGPQKVDQFFYDEDPVRWLPENYAADHAGDTKGFVDGLRIIFQIVSDHLAVNAGTCSADQLKDALYPSPIDPTSERSKPTTKKGLDAQDIQTPKKARITSSYSASSYSASLESLDPRPLSFTFPTEERGEAGLSPLLRHSQSLVQHANMNSSLPCGESIPSSPEQSTLTPPSPPKFNQ